MNSPAKKSSLLVAALALSACVNMDDVVPLKTEVPKTFSGQAAQTAPRNDYEWWRLFGDATLNKLVDIAMVESPTLQQAEARVREAQAIARSLGNWPTDSADIDIGTPRDTASYEIEWQIFGNNRLSRQAAQARAEAAEFNAQTGHVQLISQVGQAYVDLRFQQRIQQLNRLDLRSRTQTLENLEALASEGNATRLDVVRAQALLEETRARLAESTGTIAGQKQLLSTLVGRPLQLLNDDLNFSGAQPLPNRILEVGVPADLIRNNSSIRTAEKLYESAVRSLGAAKAARYPSLTLNGAILTALDTGSTARSGLASIALPILQQPRLAAEQDAAEARVDEAYAQWRGEVLLVIQEVETALAAIASAQHAASHTRRQVSLSTEALDLTRQLTQAGEATALQLLDSERDVTQARLSNAQSQRSFAQNVVLLYRALGVGVPREASDENAPLDATQVARN